MRPVRFFTRFFVTELRRQEPLGDSIAELTDLVEGERARLAELLGQRLRAGDAHTDRLAGTEAATRLVEGFDAISGACEAWLEDGPDVDASRDGGTCPAPPQATTTPQRIAPPRDNHPEPDVQTRHRQRSTR